MLTADEVKPLPHVRLVDKAGSVALPSGFKEGVEVELVELTLRSHREDVVGHLVGQQSHFRERPIGVAFTRVLELPASLGFLLVGVGPVENLLLNELTRRQSLEGCARQVEVGASGDRQELCLVTAQLVELGVEGVQRTIGELGSQLLVGYLLILTLEQCLGRFAPCTEVVLVKDDQVPVDGVNPLVLRLDQPGLLIPAKQVLERAEVHQRLVRVTGTMLSHEIGVAVLPSVKVNMAG